MRNDNDYSFGYGAFLFVKSDRVTCMPIFVIKDKIPLEFP